MEFAVPLSRLPIWLGVIAAGLIAVALILSWFDRRHQNRLHRFVDFGLASRLLPHYDATVRRPLSILTLAGFAFLALALLQPHWGHAWQEVKQYSRDMLIVLDTSESMRAENPLPSRIERAKQEINRLVANAPGDRFGLIAFAGAAAIQCPLTLDHGYFRTVLNAVNTDTISRKGSNIESGLREALKVFKEEAERSADYDPNSRAVLLISDGEEVGGDAVAAAEELAEYARIFVIGVGDPEGTVIRLPEHLRRYAQGRDIPQTHVSKLDEETLMRIAATGGGAYTRSQVDSWGTEQLYDRFRSISAREVGGEVRQQRVNRYQWPLMLAILCFMSQGVWLVLMPWVRQWRQWRGATAPAQATSQTEA